MKTLYIDCSMGISADTIFGALLELIDNPQEFLDEFNRMDFHGISYDFFRTENHGINGIVTEMKFDEKKKSREHTKEVKAEEKTEREPERDNVKKFGFFRRNAPQPETVETKIVTERKRHSGRTLKEVKKIIDDFPITSKARADAISVYELIYTTTAQVRKSDVNEMRLHSISGMDEISIITGVCILINNIAPDRITASDICVGTGYVQTNKGTLPVPIAEVAKILENLPSYGGKGEGELCTLSGAAIARTFAEEFQPAPRMRKKKMGCGICSITSDKHNYVRVFLGDTIENSSTGEVSEIKCSVKDIGSKEIGYLKRLLVINGAREAYTSQITTDEGLNAYELTCISSVELAEEMISVIMEHTTAEELRRMEYTSYKTEQEILQKDTSFGKITVKRIHGYGIDMMRPNYDDVCNAAVENGLTYREAYEKILSEI